MFDEDLAQWHTYTGATLGSYTLAEKYTYQPWLTSVAADGTCTVDVALTSASTFWTASLLQAATTFQVRITISDT